MAEIIQAWIILRSAKGKTAFCSHNMQIEVIEKISATEIVGCLMIPKYRLAGFGYASKEDVDTDCFYGDISKSIIRFADNDFWEIVSLSERADGKMEIRLQKAIDPDTK